MKSSSVLNFLLNGLRGNKTRHGRQRNVQRGDVVCVEDGLLKRYGVWTGERFILYGRNRKGDNVVHAVSFKNFMQGAEHFAICEFPKEYGRPTEWEQPIRTSSVVAPRHDWLWKSIIHAIKSAEYKVYSPEETVRRAESRLGEEDGYPTSEHFAVWCKTGIAESHELESLRSIYDHIIVY